MEALNVCSPRHAEANLAAQIEGMGECSDGVAWVVGHYYACRDCAM